MIDTLRFPTESFTSSKKDQRLNGCWSLIIFDFRPLGYPYHSGIGAFRTY
jgi:hypothetical protein